VKLEPLATYKPRQIAILTPAHGYLYAQTPDGDRSAHGADAINTLLHDLSGDCLYVLNSLEALVHTTGALSWSLSIWRGRVTRATHIPTRASVVSLRNTLDPHSAMDDLLTVHRWLRSYGVAPGSIPAMAWGLFRASLPRTYSAGFDPEIGRAAFYGGRQEASAPGVYTGMQSVDIQAAYPAAMSRPEGYALALREVDPETHLDPTAAGIAEATVIVPMDAPVAPLPVRLDTDLIAFQRGQITGTWAWTELAAARNLGAEVTVTRCWAPTRTAELFGPWWPLAMEGRRLPGRAGVLAKAISNSTWGQFGMVAEQRARRQYADDTGKRWLDIPLPDHDLPHTWTAHIAAETTARVRTQLLEGMAATLPAHSDTDGMIIRKGSTPPNMGDKPGQWRVKDDITTIDIRGPQLYRWECSECGTRHDHWHYNTSGIPVNEAATYFDGPAAVPQIGMTFRQGS